VLYRLSGNGRTYPGSLVWGLSSRRSSDQDRTRLADLHQGTIDVRRCSSDQNAAAGAGGMNLPQLVIGLPDWVQHRLPEQDRVFGTEEERMRFVIGALEHERAERDRRALCRGGPSAGTAGSLRRGSIWCSA